MLSRPCSSTLCRAKRGNKPMCPNMFKTLISSKLYTTLLCSSKCSCNSSSWWWFRGSNRCREWCLCNRGWMVEYILNSRLSISTQWDQCMASRCKIRMRKGRCMGWTICMLKVQICICNNKGLCKINSRQWDLCRCYFNNSKWWVKIYKCSLNNQLHNLGCKSDKCPVCNLKCIP